MANIITLVGILIAFGGVALTVVALDDQLLKPYPVVAEHRHLLVLIGFFLVAVSAVLIASLLVPLGRRAWEVIRDWVVGRPRPAGRYLVTDLSAAQISLAYSFITTQLRQEGVTRVLGEDTFRAAWKRNPSIYRLIWDTSGPVPQIVGFINIFPLTTAAARGLLDGSLTGGQIRPEHIPSRRARVTSVYVGAIAGASRQAKAEVLRVLRAELAAGIAAGTLPQVMTSPMTRRGRALAIEYGFQHVRTGLSGELWVRDPATSPPRT